MHFRFSIFLSLIRSLFPRWDFFDQIAFSFVVYYKVSTDTEWKKLAFTQSHKSSRLVFNQAVNDTLMQSSVVEQFARDIQELENNTPNFSKSDIEDLTTYQLLCSLLEVKLKQKNLNNTEFQFKITAHNTSEQIDIFTSDKLPLVTV
ncbi:MAG: hypothetical protein B7Y39_06800 [Bdellovibrio sp. 28-41-41]|nr:MAG: hypothetical protein B7Y39_06800 [Bdellovibrio sp. 28-41-41]